MPCSHSTGCNGCNEQFLVQSCVGEWNKTGAYNWTFSVLLTTQMSQCQLYLWGEMGSTAIFSAFSSEIRTLVELLDFPVGYFFHRLYFPIQRVRNKLMKKGRNEPVAHSPLFFINLSELIYLSLGWLIEPP